MHTDAEPDPLGEVCFGAGSLTRGLNAASEALFTAAGAEQQDDAVSRKQSVSIQPDSSVGSMVLVFTVSSVELLLLNFGPLCLFVHVHVCVTDYSHILTHTLCVNIISHKSDEVRKQHGRVTRAEH